MHADVGHCVGVEIGWWRDDSSRLEKWGSIPESWRLDDTTKMYRKTDWAVAPPDSAIIADLSSEPESQICFAISAQKNHWLGSQCWRTNAARIVSGWVAGNLVARPRLSAIYVRSWNAFLAAHLPGRVSTLLKQRFCLLSEMNVNHVG